MKISDYKKQYGQNFLYDQKILKSIYECITPSSDDLIIEIGPGSGNLTKWLQKYNCQIIAYEIDESLKSKLSLIENDKTKIIYADFLKVNLAEDISRYIYKKIYIIANIPYYITSPIIKKIISSNINPHNIVLMVQKEVGDRFIAQPGTKNYGYITVYLQYYFTIKKIINVDKSCFFPVPKIDSMIVKFTPSHNNCADFKKFDILIKDSFTQKRKNLKNNLKKYDLNKISSILNKHNYDLTNRAEDIPLEIYIEIANSI